MTADPDWLGALRAECERSTQHAVAARLGVSPSLVNQVVRGVYRADTRRFEERVRRLLMAGGVSCPELGPITGEACRTHQRRRPPFSNPDHVAVFRACHNGCPHANPEEA